jgi:predicted ArsR family transcriptional regulator
VRWCLAVPARAMFPDRHGDLTVELIGSIREALGEKALAKVIEARGGHQAAAYRAELNRTTSLKARVRRLAEIRTAEGYMAEARANADGYVLVEHHCPVCAAASACPGLCRSELEVFRAVLGPDVSVEREQHLLSGDQRCAYRIRPSGP